MTQKEKLMKTFIALQQIKSSIQSLEREAEDYDMRFHRNYTSNIIKKCDEAIKLLK